MQIVCCATHYLHSFLATGHLETGHSLHHQLALGRATQRHTCMLLPFFVKCLYQHDVLCITKSVFYSKCVYFRVSISRGF